MVFIVWSLDLQLSMQSVPITTNIVSSNLLGRGVLDTKLCYKDCQWLAAGRWFSTGTPVSSTNKSDCHDKTGILLKVALKTITLTLIVENLQKCVIQSIIYSLFWNSIFPYFSTTLYVILILKSRLC